MEKKDNNSHKTNNIPFRIYKDAEESKNGSTSRITSTPITPSSTSGGVNTFTMSFPIKRKLTLFFFII